MQFDQNENLIVCDAYKGLLAVDPNGRIRTLATAAEGVPLNSLMHLTSPVMEQFTLRMPAQNLLRRNTFMIFWNPALMGDF